VFLESVTLIPVRRLDYEVSSGNIFRDLGFPDAEELHIKASLAIEIGQIIRRRGLTQKSGAVDAWH
jgi:predicted XRE-type DNA-binding protein